MVDAHVALIDALKHPLLWSKIDDGVFLHANGTRLQSTPIPEGIVVAWMAPRYRWRSASTLDFTPTMIEQDPDIRWLGKLYTSTSIETAEDFGDLLNAQAGPKAWWRLRVLSHFLAQYAEGYTWERPHRDQPDCAYTPRDEREFPLKRALYPKLVAHRLHVLTESWEVRIPTSLLCESLSSSHDRIKAQPLIEFWTKELLL